MKAERDRASGRRDPSNASFQIWILHFLYDLIYLSIVVLLSPLLVYKFITSRRARAGLRQRLGSIPRREGDRPCIWIHGVSVGEVKAAMGLLEALPHRMPDWEVVLSTTTMQGYQVARTEQPDILTFYYPLDFSLVTYRALRRIRPGAVVLMELELWPNFLLECHRQGIPVCLVNGRISQRSYNGYRMARRFLPEPHQRIRFYGVQNEEYADRIRDLGVRPEVVHVTGQMKYDTIHADPESVPALRREYRRILGLADDDWVLIGGSTHPSEEDVLLEAVIGLLESDAGRRVRLILVPRHMERLSDVEDCVRRAGCTPVRRTRLSDGRAPTLEAKDVIVVDTMGELAKLYTAADLVFVGGSLIPHGGQSMIEPASLGLPVIFGPHVWNFADSVRSLLDADAALQVESSEAFVEAVLALRRDEPRRRQLGERARAVVSSLKGATTRNVDLIVRMLDGMPSA